MTASIKLTIENTRPISAPASAAQSASFNSSFGTIKIGRDPAWADFVTPKEDNRVSNRHLVIRQEDSGSWIVEPQGKYYVEVDGRAVDNREALGESAQLRLGRKDGPLLRFERIHQTWISRVTETLVTATQELVPKWQDKLREHAYRFAAALAVVALGLGGLAGHSYYLEQRTSGLESDLAEISIAPEFRDLIREAAYLVVLQDAAGRKCAKATAFPVRSTTMVTNAHVARLRNSLGEGEAMLVCSPGDASKCYTVEDMSFHDGYETFTDFVAETTLGTTTFRSEFREASRPGAYDVALLHLAEPVNPAHILEIAEPEDILALKPGTPLAMAGYLLDNIDGADVAPIYPMADLHFGTVSAITDFFNFGGRAENTQLVQHSVPVTGGASGSPIIDTSGKVIAVLSAGSVVDTGKVAASSACGRGVTAPNAALVNYAQRADLVLELIEADRPFDLKRAETFWAEQATRFENHAAYVRNEFLRAFEDTAGGHTSLKTDLRQLEGPGLAQESVPVALRAGSTFGFLAYAEHKESLQLLLRIDGDIVAENAREWMPQIIYEADRTVDAELQVIGSPAGKLGYDLISVEAAAKTN